MRFFTLGCFFVVTLLGFDWEYSKQITLKKDAVQTIYVKSRGVEREFSLRWTLFKANELVVISSYDEFNKQLLLNRERGGVDSFRVELLPRAQTNVDTPYLFIQFLSFDFEEETATFQLFLKDKRAKILLEFDKKSVN